MVPRGAVGCATELTSAVVLDTETCSCFDIADRVQVLHLRLRDYQLHAHWLDVTFRCRGHMVSKRGDSADTWRHTAARA